MLCKLSIVSILSSSSFVALASAAACTINSASDIPSVQACNAITINAFTMPPKKTLTLNVRAVGDITFPFGGAWPGPLMRIFGNNINYSGNGHKLICNGESYWGAKGGGGSTKPGPALSLLVTGTVSDLIIQNTPANAIVIEANGKTTLSRITIDNKLGDTRGAHNTDGINIVGNTNDLTVMGCTVINQDDCIAVTSAKGINLINNKCYSGHGISIGSIKTGQHVSGVMITGNHVENSQQGYRIKTYSGATQASVSDITFSGNTGIGLHKYGVVIEQDYANDRPKGPSGVTSGVMISNVKFTGAATTLSVDPSAQQVYVLCGQNSCVGAWDWASLKTSGGRRGSIVRAPIKGWSL